jgi:hypothetical protein
MRKPGGHVSVDDEMPAGVRGGERVDSSSEFEDTRRCQREQLKTVVNATTDARSGRCAVPKTGTGADEPLG